MDINRLPNKQLHSDNYSGNRLNQSFNNNNNNNKKFSNNYSGNQFNNLQEKQNEERKHNTVIYRGMDGKEYYDKRLLDVANRMYLEEKNKGD